MSELTYRFVDADGIETVVNPCYWRKEGSLFEAIKMATDYCASINLLDIRTNKYRGTVYPDGTYRLR